MATTCPNINLEEWKVLVAGVGEREAYRDYVETKGSIRTPEAVEAKIKKRKIALEEAGILKFNPNPSLDEMADAINGPNPEAFVDPSVHSKTLRAVELADKMSEALGVEYSIITRDQAVQITGRAATEGFKWNGQAAFFFAGKVYFLQDQLTSDNVFHEFSHPLVRAISVENPGLFNKLYTDLAATKEGTEIINHAREHYTGLDPESDYFKEEVIVNALTKDGSFKLSGQETPAGFKKVIADILFSMKQFLRKIFGKGIKISKLSTDTTLDELASILTKGDLIEIHNDVISQNDIVAYSNELRGQVSRDLSRAGDMEIRSVVDNFHVVITNHIQKLRDDENYAELAALLVDNYNLPELSVIKGNLSRYITDINAAADKMVDEVKEGKQRVDALTSSLFTLGSVMDSLLSQTRSLAKGQDTQENMRKVSYHKRLTKHWAGFADKVMKVVDDNNIDKNSEIYKLINGIQSNIRKTDNIISDIDAKGARDGLYAVLEPLRRSVNEKYKQLIDDAKATKNYPKQKMDQLYKAHYGMTQEEYTEFERLQAKRDAGTLTITEDTQKYAILEQKRFDGTNLTKDMMEKFMKNEGKDANVVSSYLEGYLYNPDPIIGGLGLYTKNELNKVMIVTQQKSNDFAMDIMPLIEAAGIDVKSEMELGSVVWVEDTIRKLNKETQEFEDAKVYTFHNEFIGDRQALGLLREGLKKATDDHHDNNTDESKQALIAAKYNMNKFVRDYYHQQYSPKFYERYELFEKDDVGKVAATMRDDHKAEMKALDFGAPTQQDQLDIADVKELKLKEWKQMHSLVTPLGQPKSDAINPETGVSDLAVAQRLIEFRDASKEFYEQESEATLNADVFANAYQEFIEQLEADNIEGGRGSEEWNERLDKWFAVNTRSAIKPEFYDRRTVLFQKIKEILKDLKGSENYAEIQADLNLQINNEISIYRKGGEEHVGADMSAGTIAYIKKLNEQLEEAKQKKVLNSGLTAEEMKRFKELRGKQTDRIQLGSAEFNELEGYTHKMRNNGLSKKQNQQLMAIYSELREMSTKQPTDSYLDTVNEWMTQTSSTELSEIYQVTSDLTKNNIGLLYDQEVLDELFESNAEFKTWFEDNHIKKDVFDSDAKRTVQKWERISAWTISKPTDPSMMASYQIKDSTGKVLATTPGLPTSKYHSTDVKLKYKTREIIGVTKDNQGMWLPKAMKDRAPGVDDKFINKDYVNYREASRAFEASGGTATQYAKGHHTFKLIEKLKEHHLNHQEGLSRGNKLWMDAPRFAKNNLENILTTTLGKSTDKKENVFQKSVKRWKDLFKKGGPADASEDGINFKTTDNIRRADLLDDDMTSGPVAGLFDLDFQDISKNVTESMMRYMSSAERQKQLVKARPLVDAIQATVTNFASANARMDQVEATAAEGLSILDYKKNKGSIRKAAVDNHIEKEYNRQVNKGALSDNAAANNVASFFFKRASFAFFALNIPSGLKNSMGMKFQQLIQASGKQYVDHMSLQRGNAWAYKAMGELSFGGIYAKGTKSYKLQLIDIFDPIQGRFEEKLGTEFSRSLTKDAASMSWLYSPRKWVETQAGLQLFGGMMDKKRLKRTLEDGSEVDIKYIDAFEVVEGQIQLKSGIDVRYGAGPTVHQVVAGDTVESIAAQYNMTVEDTKDAFNNKDIDAMLNDVNINDQLKAAALFELNEKLAAETDLDTQTKLIDEINVIKAKYDKIAQEKGTVTIDNSEFNFMKNRVHQVQNNMGGAYASFDQPEAHRYIAFRFVAYLRKYFTTMAMNRWGFSGNITDPRPRLNPGLGDTQIGFYVQFGKTLSETIQNVGGNLPFLRPEEIDAAKRMLSEVAYLFVTTMLMGVLFGWDPEDKNRFKKLRAKSGAMPFLGTEEDPNNPFDLLGFAELQSLQLLMQIRAENEQFNFLTKNGSVGLAGIGSYVELLDLKSVAFGPTTDSYVQILDDWGKILTGDPGANYSRKVGPYAWQSKGGSKFLNHFGKMFGVTGSSLNPNIAIENFQSYQSQVRR